MGERNRSRRLSRVTADYRIDLGIESTEKRRDQTLTRTFCTRQTGLTTREPAAFSRRKRRDRGCERLLGETW